MSLRMLQPAARRGDPVAVARQIERAAICEPVREGSCRRTGSKKFRASAAPAAILESRSKTCATAFRLIRRSPLFSAVVVLILTVGIGINASVFTVVNGIALTPARLSRTRTASFGSIRTSRLQGKQRQVSFSEYVAWRDQTRSLRQLAAFSYIGVLVGEDDPTGSRGPGRIMQLLLWLTASTAPSWAGFSSRRTASLRTGCPLP